MKKERKNLKDKLNKLFLGFWIKRVLSVFSFQVIAFLVYPSLCEKVVQTMIQGGGRGGAKP